MKFAGIFTALWIGLVTLVAIGLSILLIYVDILSMEQLPKYLLCVGDLSKLYGIISVIRSTQKEEKNEGMQFIILGAGISSIGALIDLAIQLH